MKVKNKMIKIIFLGKKTKLPKENEENEENENQKNEENEKKEKNEENEENEKKKKNKNIFKVINAAEYIDNVKEVICNNEYDTKISSNVSKENDDFSTSVQTKKKKMKMK